MGADATVETVGRRERKKQLTRQHIAETAWTLFTERGFDQVTVAEIADAADVSEQTVFNHFPTKEDLVYWRMGSFEEELLDAIRTRAPDESVLDSFGRFMRTPRGLLDRRNTPSYTRAMAATRLIESSPALQAREQRVFESYTDALAALIAQETGSEEGDTESWVAANAIMGVHRAVMAHVRRALASGVSARRLAHQVERQLGLALGLLETGLGDYPRTRAQPSSNG